MQSSNGGLKMTPEAQRIAIAEACGWMFDHINRYAMYYVPSTDCHVGDPLSDLNACREASKFLTYEQCEQYASHIWEIVMDAEDDMENPRPSNFACLTATAAQRCEAFLKTIGKWTDDN